MPLGLAVTCMLNYCVFVNAHTPRQNTYYNKGIIVLKDDKSFLATLVKLVNINEALHAPFRNHSHEYLFFFFVRFCFLFSRRRHYRLLHWWCQRDCHIQELRKVFGERQLGEGHLQLRITGFHWWIVLEFWLFHFTLLKSYSKKYLLRLAREPYIVVTLLTSLSDYLL